jgi:AcrR family transcriptional regulator
MTIPHARRSAGPDAGRRRQIIQAASGVFLRYGLRKTSMEDLAHAAGLSRQGLYLHFANKDEVFRAVIEQLAQLTLAAAKAELARRSDALENRLLAAFGAMASAALADADAASVRELFASATELAGDVVTRLDEQIVSVLAQALRERRRGRGAAGDIPPRALAEHLYATAYGLQHRGHLGADYLHRMRIAIRLVCGT